ncbi:hypothetical protein ACJX0J_032244 [Zea mays]
MALNLMLFFAYNATGEDAMQLQKSACVGMADKMTTATPNALKYNAIFSGPNYITTFMQASKIITTNLNNVGIRLGRNDNEVDRLIGIFWNSRGLADLAKHNYLSTLNVFLAEMASVVGADLEDNDGTRIEEESITHDIPQVSDIENIIDPFAYLIQLSLEDMWGLKAKCVIDRFEKRLAMRLLLNQDGTWQQLLKNKYLGSKSLTQAVRKSGDSHFWAGLWKILKNKLVNDKYSRTEIYLASMTPVARDI